MLIIALGDGAAESLPAVAFERLQGIAEPLALAPLAPDLAAMLPAPPTVVDDPPVDATLVATDIDAQALALRFPDAETVPDRELLRGRAIGAQVAALAGVGTRLRRDCPWDRRQTLDSIAPYTVEEAFEVAEAIDGGERYRIIDEVGDLLFQAVFFGQLLEEEGVGDLGTIADGQARKLISRHPHVYGEDVAADVSDVKDIWEREKRRERADQGIFHDLPPGLPALAFAAKTEKRAASVGFVFSGPELALEKLREEVAELSADTGADELGDVIFAAVGLAARLGVDPEIAVRSTAARFRRRVETASRLAEEAGEAFENLSLDDQLTWYQTAKKALE